MDSRMIDSLFRRFVRQAHVPSESVEQLCSPCSARLKAGMCLIQRCRPKGRRCKTAPNLHRHSGSLVASLLTLTVVATLLALPPKAFGPEPRSGAARRKAPCGQQPKRQEAIYKLRLFRMSRKSCGRDLRRWPRLAQTRSNSRRSASTYASLPARCRLLPSRLRRTRTWRTSMLPAIAAPATQGGQYSSAKIANKAPRIARCRSRNSFTLSWPSSAGPNPILLT